MKTNSLIKFLPSFRDIFFISLFIAVLLLGQRMLNLDGDLPRHLLTGKFILETRSLPTREPFIYPYFNQAYIPHEWLTDIILYLLYKITGLPGTVVFAAVLISSTFTILYNQLSRRLRLRLAIFILTALGALATSINWAVRPHLVSMLFLVIWLFWVDDLRLGKTVPLWRFPALMILWSNLHGEFIAGILVILAFCAGWVYDFLFNRNNTSIFIGKNLFAALVLSVIGSLVNPSGLAPYTSILGYVNNPYLMSRMVEANAPNFHNPELRVVLILILLSIFLLSVSAKKLSAGQGLLLTGFTAMGLIAIRNIHLYGIVAPFVLAETLGEVTRIPIIEHLESTLENVESRMRGILWPVLAVIVLGAGVLLNRYSKVFYQFDSPAFPVEAVKWLEQNPQEGNLFNELNWGGYIALHLWPAQKTFIDSMADTSGDITKQYETVITLANGWETLLSRYEIEWVIIEKDSLLSKTLQSQPQWNILFEDDTTIILRRTEEFGDAPLFLPNQKDEAGSILNSHRRFS